MTKRRRILTTTLQIEHAKAGVYAVKGASGFGFKKESDARGVGSYTVRFRFDGKRPTMGLGAFSEIKLAAACEAAIAAVALARKGINPIEERKRKRAANLAAERAKEPVTFAQSAATFLEAHSPAWKHRYAAQTFFNPIKKYADPIIGKLPVNDVSARHVAAVMGAAEAAGFPATGLKLRRHLSAIFNAAIANGDRDPARGNPADARLIRAMRPLGQGGDRHYRRLELDAAPATFCALREASAQATGLDAWLLTILTVLRPSEALNTQWSEVDFQKKLLTVSAARMKGKRGKTKAHVVPLSALALDILERRRQVSTGDAVFAAPSGSPISYTNFALAPKRAGIDAGSPHSWRSVFRDWATEIGNIAPHLAELALAHALPKVQAAYARGTAIEPRGPVMEAYARWLSGDAGADVIAFPTRA